MEVREWLPALVLQVLWQQVQPSVNKVCWSSIYNIEFYITLTICFRSNLKLNAPIILTAMIPTCAIRAAARMHVVSKSVALMLFARPKTMLPGVNVCLDSKVRTQQEGARNVSDSVCMCFCECKKSLFFS